MRRPAAGSRRGPVRALVAMWLSLLAGCDLRGSDPPVTGTVVKQATSDEHHELGRRLYNYRCYFCHGYSGDARTVAAGYLQPAPRDFTADPARELTRGAMLAAVTDGVSGTAMKSFAGVLTDDERQAVVDFVRREFIGQRASNTRYHTADNGWPDHQRYEPAFAFARGELTVETPLERLSGPQRAGRDLFLGACVSCHDNDRGRDSRDSPAWQIRPVTYPPDYYILAEAGKAPEDPSFDPHHVHEQAPRLAGLNAQERQGQRLFRDNCAHCHAADGTGRNWRGSFLEPPPPDLTRGRAAAATRDSVAAVVRDGVAGTAMPAWQAVLLPRQIDAVAAYTVRLRQ